MANAPITSAAASLGSSGLNSLLTYFMDSFESQKRNRNSILIHCNTDASALVAQQGQTVTIPLYATTASSLITDGDAIVGDDSTGSTSSVTLNKHRATKFSLTQVAQALDGNKVVNGLLQGRINGVLNDIETDVCSVVTSGFTTNTVGTYNSAITEANATLAMGNLFAQKVPEGELVALVHPSVNAWQALVQIPEFADYQNTGMVSQNNQANYGSIGQYWHGARWFMSQGVNKSGTSVDNFVMHKNAICVAMRAFDAPMAPGVQAVPMNIDGVALQVLLQWNGDRLADEMVVHALYGYAVGEEKFGALFKS